MFRLSGVMEENKRVKKTKKYTVLLIPRQALYVDSRGRFGGLGRGGGDLWAIKNALIQSEKRCIL